MLQYWLFISISILNAIDGLATFYGLKINVVEEQNPIALMLWDTHPLLFLSAKILVSILILYFPLLTAKHIWQKKRWTITLTAVVMMYLFVNAIHLIWLSIHFQIV